MLKVLKKSNKNRFREIISVIRKYKLTKEITPEKVRLIFEELGPTFVKLGQILSMREDIIPINYCEEFTKLRNEVAPMKFDEVEFMIENSLNSNIEGLFTEFDKVPLGSASIAQAHLAVLRKTGEKVVVKVQRKGIYDIMEQDVILLHRISKFMKLIKKSIEVVDVDMVLDEIWKVAKEEMDFLTEAKNAEKFYTLNKNEDYIISPNIYNEFTTSKVITMEYIDGFSIIDKNLIKKNNCDIKNLGLKLANNYIKQIVEDGFFHADPHPGNIKVINGKLGWIDFGMMGTISYKDKKLLGQAVLALYQQDTNKIKDILLAIGKCNEDIDHSKLYIDIDSMLSRYRSLDLGDMNFGDVIQELMNLAKVHSISMPSSISMLARGMITIEGVIAEICPEFSLVEIAANRLSENMIKDINLKKEISNNFLKVLLSGKKVFEIPFLISDILKIFTKSQSKVNIELYGSNSFKKFLNMITNKIVLGLIITALIIGSSLICLSDNIIPRFLNIPVISLIGYLSSLILIIYIMKKK